MSVIEIRAGRGVGIYLSASSKYHRSFELISHSSWLAPCQLVNRAVIQLNANECMTLFKYRNPKKDGYLQRHNYKVAPLIHYFDFLLLRFLISTWLELGGLSSKSFLAQLWSGYGRTLTLLFDGCSFQNSPNIVRQISSCFHLTEFIKV